MVKGKRVIGLILVLVSIFALVSWEKWGKNRFIYDRVIVLKSDVKEGDVLTEDMIKTRHMERWSKAILTADDIDSVIGKAVTGYIRRDSPIFAENLQDKELITNEEKGEYVFTIPADWVAAVPETMDMGNRVYFYVRGKLLTSAVVKRIGAERKAFDVIATDKKVRALSRAFDNGVKLVLTYNR